jgi:hypothetical protein
LTATDHERSERNLVTIVGVGAGVVPATVVAVAVVAVTPVVTVVVVAVVVGLVVTVLSGGQFDFFDWQGGLAFAAVEVNPVAAKLPTAKMIVSSAKRERWRRVKGGLLVFSGGSLAIGAPFRASYPSFRDPLSPIRVDALAPPTIPPVRAFPVASLS